MPDPDKKGQSGIEKGHLAIGKRHLGYTFNDQQYDLDDLVVQIPMLNPV